MKSIKLKVIVGLISLITVATSGVALGVKNNESNEENQKTSVVREVKNDERKLEKGTAKKVESNKEAQTIAKVAVEAIKEIEQAKPETKQETVENERNEESKQVESTKKEQKEEKAVASVSTVEDRYEEPRKESKVETVAEPKAPETKPEAQSGVMTKYEDVGIILVTKCQYMPIIGGYASTTRYALIDLVEGKMAIIDYTKIIDGVWNSLTEEEKLEEGSKDQYDTREYTLSNEERETIYNMVKNAQNNINSNDVYSFEFYRDNMFDIQAAGMWEYEDDGTDNDYFKIDSSKYEETVYVFDNAAQIKFLHNLLEK